MLISATYADHHVRVSQRRASHVEPNNIVLRKIFHMIRARFGEKGKMANFTRQWPCLWRVNMTPSGGPVLTGRWRKRQMALASEVEWLRQQLFGQLN
jgi:hypothetical protein